MKNKTVERTISSSAARFKGIKHLAPVLADGGSTLYPDRLWIKLDGPVSSRFRGIRLVAQAPDVIYSIPAGSLEDALNALHSRQGLPFLLPRLT